MQTHSAHHLILCHWQSWRHVTFIWWGNSHLACPNSVILHKAQLWHGKVLAYIGRFHNVQQSPINYSKNVKMKALKFIVISAVMDNRGAFHLVFFFHSKYDFDCQSLFPSKLSLTVIHLLLFPAPLSLTLFLPLFPPCPYNSPPSLIILCLSLAFSLKKCR